MTTVIQVVYDVTDDAIALKRGQYAVLKADTKEGYEQVRLAIADCRETRSAIEKRRKELKADSLEYGRKVDAVAKHLTEQIEAIEGPLKAQKAAIDEEKARVKAEKEAAAQKAIAEVEARLKAEADRLAADRAALDAERAAMEAQRQPAASPPAPAPVPVTPEDTVTITKTRYRELLRAKAKLIALESMGVDNWCGYEDAMHELRNANTADE
jgi:dsDNA-specific endonuclease/ATPase MutS2